MTTLVIEHFDTPASGRDSRRLELARQRAADDMAGRTVWCATAVPSARSAADALRACLRAMSEEGVGAGSIWVRAESDDLVGDDVHAGDVVVLHDPVCAGLAEAVRARGAHAIWRVSPEPRRGPAAELWRSMRVHPPGLDAYIVAWRERHTRRPATDGLAAFIAAADVVSAKEIAPRRRKPGYDDLGWTSLLADVVRADRNDCVGGTLHARPSVAAR